MASLCDLHFTRSAKYVTKSVILQRYHSAFRPSNVNTILTKIALRLFCMLQRHRDEKLTVESTESSNALTCLGAGPNKYSKFRGRQHKEEPVRPLLASIATQSEI